jgi:hypothetical protein
LVIAQSPTQVATYGAIGLQFNTWLESPVGLGDFTVDADREKIYPLLDSLVERRKAVALAEGDLTWYRLLHANKAWLLKGTGTVNTEVSLQTWMQSMRFATLHDGEVCRPLFDFRGTPCHHNPNPNPNPHQYPFHFRAPFARRRGSPHYASLAWPAALISCASCLSKVQRSRRRSRRS